MIRKGRALSVSLSANDVAQPRKKIKTRKENNVKKVHEDESYDSENSAIHVDLHSAPFEFSQVDDSADEEDVATKSVLSPEQNLKNFLSKTKRCQNKTGSHPGELDESEDVDQSKLLEELSNNEQEVDEVVQVDDAENCEEEEQEVESDDECEDEDSLFGEDHVERREFDDLAAEVEDAESEGEKRDFGNFTTAFLKRLEQSQTAILEERAQHRTPLAILKTRKKLSSACSSPALHGDGTLKSIREEWAFYTGLISPSFFKSKEARLQLRGRVTRGTPAYQGLNLTHRNNADVKKIYRVRWQSKADLGQSVGTYEQFRIVVGQYARFAVAAKMCHLDELCRPGALFEIICNLTAVQSFIRYFDIRSAAGTVMNKAFHLLVLSKFAKSHFGEVNNSVRQGTMISIIEYLHATAKAFKNECRRQASIRKESETRVGSGNFLTESDIAHYGSAGLDVLNSIMDSCKGIYNKKGDAGVMELLKKTNKIVQKWCMNFLSTMMLHGGGQRPQVMSMIEAPKKIDLVDLRNMVKESGVFSLRVSYEKRIRSVDLPHVLFPRAMYRALNFHVNYVLPVLYEKHGIGEGDSRRNCLIIHTKSGYPLESYQVTATLKSFLKSYDPELGNVNSMTLRASFATSMLKKHRRGEKFGAMSEEEFLGYLAKIMNTSVEQLKDTYVASDETSFEVCAEMMQGMIGTAEENCNVTDTDLNLF